MTVSTVSNETVAGITVVVAVFNGAETLAELTRRVEAVLTSCGGSWELVLVNDGSGDASWQTIEALSHRYAWVRGIDLARNVGQHNALLCAVRHARHRVIVTIDDDLQHAPEDIPRLLHALGPEVDVVYGIPVRPNQSVGRILGSWLLGWLLRLWGTGRAPRYSAFRAFRSRLREPFAVGIGPHVCLDVLLSWSTSRFARVDIEHRPSDSRRSRYGLAQLIGLAHEALVGFGITPARPAAVAGTAFLVLGGVGVGFDLLAAKTADTPCAWIVDPGFAILVGIGVQLVLFAWGAALLTRIHEATMGRPPYVVARTTDDSPDIRT